MTAFVGVKEAGKWSVAWKLRDTMEIVNWVLAAWQKALGAKAAVGWMLSAAYRNFQAAEQRIAR